MSISLKNKVVLITGASSGFGEDAAKLFAAEGCKVILAARRLDRLQTLAAEIQSKGGEALAVPADVNERAEIEVMVQTALDLYGKIDILFNNAGYGAVNWFENLKPERDIETLIRVNLIGTMLVTRAVIPHMLERGEGHVINMVSVAGLIAAPTITSYSASKYGARAFTDALRREVGHLGIKVSGIYPGPAVTEFGDKLERTQARKTIRRIKYPHLTSEYVAQRVVDVAKRPRRTLVIPWWFLVITTFDTLFPVAVDWILYFFAKKNHNLD
ncbi:MAG TPA: SDR family oxidoreductase [Anaerolineales bacterium]|nr:SDR family oxidoreductase [Anaerolineales bacterium]HNQ96438.1 SDR family oxidoreductase [Anaerolineales bacterium]HNS62390.1 SDR family oxidoreductase [Anaerolineales bacterium]